jgi:CTP-dependent riboflavin kinase
MIFDKIVIFGLSVQGLRESSSFTEISWVKEKFTSKLGFTPYPGTFNLEIKDGDSLKRWRELKRMEGIEIEPQ